MRTSVLLSLAACVMVAAGPSLEAENRYYIDEAPLLAGAADQRISILCDNDQTVLGYSVGLRIEPAKLGIAAVTHIGTAAETADFFVGSHDAASGLAAYGVVFDTDGDFSTQKLDPGTGHVIGILQVDVLATTDTTAAVAFESVTLPSVSVDPVSNIMSDTSAVSIIPALAGGVVPIETRAPEITALANNSGRAGDTFQVTGEFFDEPDLEVTVCGAVAAATLRGDGVTIDVVAPECGSLGFAAVEVCTGRGCDSRAEGFLYEPDPLPVITGFEGNQGEAGRQFTVIGENFDEEGLTVAVCGKPAEFAPPTDGGTRVLVTAPECETTGPVEVEVCNVFGCDSDPAGFDYGGQSDRFMRADVNSDDSINITDGIAVLTFLFVDPTKTLACNDAGDADDNGRLELTDAVVIFQWLFVNPERPPQPPSPSAGDYLPADCGVDPTETDALDCANRSAKCS